MPTKDAAQQYIDYLARAISLTETFPDSLSRIQQLADYKKFSKSACDEMDNAWKKGTDQFLCFLSGLIDDLEKQTSDGRFIWAEAICRWMDQRITYVLTDDTTAFSLYPIFPLCGDHPIVLDHFNTNRAATGIQIFPKFKTASILERKPGAEWERTGESRNVHAGINGLLKNVGYLKDSPNISVHHIVVPYGYTEGGEEDPITVAFCPLSSADDHLILQATKTPVEYNGMKYDGRVLQGIRHEKELTGRVERDLRLAAEGGAFIAFFPEMLGTAGLEQDRNGFNPQIRQSYLSMMKESISPPTLTFLPSYWRDGHNSVTIVYQDGKILGRQEKYVPYEDAGGHWIEVLAPAEVQDIYLIHVPGVHRIAVMICADFLEKNEFVCESLGATLVLVPSYTPGEEDFINALPRLKRYGATVIWGNCCGARAAPRVIGGCSIAGTDDCRRFCDRRSCGDSCDGRKACAFLVSLPLRLVRDKPGGGKWENAIRHCLADE